MIWFFRVADLVDILLVAVLLYIVFWWMSQQMTESTMRGIGVVTLLFLGIYLPARAFEMYMMEQISQLLMIFALLAIVVIFQSDFRQMIYSAGARLFGQNDPVEQSDGSTIDVLVESITQLAKESTGALIAIRGRDPWDHYIQGGVALNGYVSAPLMHSLFDPSTDGHDGAALLEGDRVRTFAAHLPLADQLPHESRYGGARHAAALGLADVCDALVLAVSEEHGTISVAHKGKIEPVETASELKETLNDFWATHYSASSAEDRKWLSWRTVRTAALSIGVAVLLWFSVAYSPGTVYRSFDVPIEYHDVPSDWTIEDEPSTARVTLSGPDQAFRLIDPNQLSVAFSLASPQQGTNQLMINEGDLDLPPRITLTSASPRTVEVSAYPLQPTRLSVSIPTEGTIPDSLQLVRTEASPDSVTILTSEGNTYSDIETEPVVLDSILKDTTIERSLIPQSGMQIPEDSLEAVEVSVDVQTIVDEGDN